MFRISDKKNFAPFLVAVLLSGGVLSANTNAQEIGRVFRDVVLPL